MLFRVCWSAGGASAGAPRGMDVNFTNWHEFITLEMIAVIREIRVGLFHGMFRGPVA
jgi:hypothetical protein